ncbi:HK97 family phage prohead protease [Bernardetia sp. Wsw4-3y2]|uniref:HK97 family phage prohead protease n=1 Tax=Bernardetia sp. Wsw4-3y2 TaxID=3127471 RepID=UPI0030D17E85
MKKLILSDESINSYGYRVLTKGIDLTAYKKNPIVLYNHNRYQGLVGKGIDVAIVGNQLVAKDIEFYEGNNYAADIKRKFDEGFLNAFSIGIQILETSDDPKDLAKGQRYATVTKCKLVEFSIVEMPSNSNAVRLYDENMQELSMSDLTILSNPLDTVDLALPKVEEQTKNLISMEKLLQKLGLASNATETQAIEAFDKLQNELTQKLSATTQKVIEKYVKFDSEEKKKAFATLAAIDFDSALSLLGDTTSEKTEGKKEESKKTEIPTLSLLDAIKQLQTGNTQEKTALLSWDDYQTNDPKGLQELQANDFEKFSKLYEGKFGVPAPK